MPKGIICITPRSIEDYFDLSIDPALIDLGKLGEALLLPERYTVEKVRRHPFFRYAWEDDFGVEIIVSSPDIPEVAQGEPLPNVLPCYLSITSSDAPKTYNISLQDLLINGVSVIREEDKQRVAAREFKAVKDNHVDARDTQFQGFAKALWDEIGRMQDAFCEERGANIYDIGRAQKLDQSIQKFIARRAHDLVFHTLNYTTESMTCMFTDEAIEAIPDMTELPKEIDEAEIARKKEIDEILSHASELDAMELYEKLCNVGLPKEE